MSKADIVFDAIGQVPPALIEEALDHRFRRRTLHMATPWLAAAACVALLVVTVRFSGLFALSGADSNGSPGGSATAPVGDAVEEAPPGAEDGMPSQDDGYWGGTQEPPSGLYTVTAQVLEVREDGPLVEVLDGGDLTGGVFLLPGPAAPDLAEGQVVAVTWPGEIDWDSDSQVFLGEIRVEAVRP